MTLHIHILRKVLSDDSEVYDVQIGDVILAAYTARDAHDMALGMARLIDKHACEDVVRVFSDGALVP